MRQLSLFSANKTYIEGPILLIMGVAACTLGCRKDDQEPTSEGVTCGSVALHEAPHGVCEAMDAVAVGDGNGDCLCFLGYAWDGSDCVALSNCTCEGIDCNKLTERLEECQTQHASCGSLELACGSEALHESSHEMCEPMDVAAVRDENGDCYCFLGYAWDGTQCVALANCVCEGADCDKLTETLEECERQHESCESPDFGCGSDALYESPHDLCDPMDAVAVGDEYGDCRCFLGYAWDGTQCVALANCACEGADCDKLTMTLEECERQHESCESPGFNCGSEGLYGSSHDVCDPMDAAAVGDENGDCYCFLGYAWDGTQCVALANCACKGADCDKLTETLEECENSHRPCK